MFRILILCLIISCTIAHNAQQWKSRTIYQLLTDRFARNDGSTPQCDLHNYCGGGYKGIINNLDYIAGMGFDAIWISPIIYNRQGGYHGYWGLDLYRLNDHFGTEQDFRDFVSQCHRRNIWVMVDVVGNHMGNLDENYQNNHPFNSRDHYHDFCIISDQDFATKNQNRIQNCRLASLADLKQQNDYVRTELLKWIKDLIQKYSIDGIRIDTVPEVPKWFWSQFKDAAGVYTVGEAFDGSMSYVGGYVGSLDACLNYPFFFWFRDTIFNFKDMTNLRNYYIQWGKNLDPNKLNYMANFVDNHDNARVLSWQGDWEQKKIHYKTVNVLALTTVGIPIIYYGTEQYFAGGNDPYNRQIMWKNLNTGSQMYQYLKKVIEARKLHRIWDQPQVERYADYEFYCFSRGKFLVATTNKVSGTVSKFVSYHPFSNGEKICNIFYPTTDCLTVSGGFNIYLLNGQSKIYVSA